ncbi:MAG: hypothetical protein NC925_03415 [Candidatus Omnitrophica bacterium]|nr:hypothetical protein [Candidatus Omnitrophota bacterium]MCM8830863.1 hypothetical protein [Candidatus Omnitrophota bacterium]
MEEKTLRTNFLFTIAKFILFLLIFCFAISFSKEFIKEIKATKTIKTDILLYSIFSCFLFYTFFVNLNNLYGRFQKFFFHNSIFSLIISSFFIILGLGFFLIPKLFNLKFDKNIFLFSGGFILTAHLIFIAQDLKGTNLFTFINYLFIFSILYIFNLFLFTIYLNIAFKVSLIKIITSGTKEAVILIRNIFTQVVG